MQDKGTSTEYIKAVATEVDSEATRSSGPAREMSVNIGVGDSDNPVPGSGVDPTETIRVVLVDRDRNPNDEKVGRAVDPVTKRLLNHNHLVREGIDLDANGIANIRFLKGKAGAPQFNYEHADIFTDVEGRYFLIEVEILSTSTLPRAQNDHDVTKRIVRKIKIYVSNLNDEPVAFSNTGMDKVPIDDVETDRITLTVGENNAALGRLTAASIEGGVNTVITFTNVGQLPYGIQLDQATGALTLADGFDYDTLSQDHRDNGITFMVQAMLTTTTVNAAGQAVRTSKTTAPTQVRLRVTDVDEPVMFNQAPAPVRQPVGNPVTPPAVIPTPQQNPDSRPRLELPDPQPGAAKIVVDVPENQPMVGWFTISDSDASHDPAQLPTLSLTGDHAELFEVAYLSDGATRLVVLRFKQNPNYEKGFARTQDQTGWQYGDGAHAGAYRVNLVLNAGSTVHQQQVIPVLVTVTDQAEQPTFVVGGDAPAQNPTGVGQLAPDPDNPAAPVRVTVFEGPSLENGVPIANGRTYVGWFRISDDHPALVRVEINRGDLLSTEQDDTDSTLHWLYFDSAPDHEAPGDQNGDNVYEVSLYLKDQDGQPLPAQGQTQINLQIWVNNINGPMAFTGGAITNPAPALGAFWNQNGQDYASQVFTVSHPDPQNDPSLPFDGSGNLLAAPRTGDYHVTLDGGRKTVFRLPGTTNEVQAITGFGRYGNFYLVEDAGSQTNGGFRIYYEIPPSWTKGARKTPRPMAAPAMTRWTS